VNLTASGQPLSLYLQKKIEGSPSALLCHKIEEEATRFKPQAFYQDFQDNAVLVAG
jgi:hypothetical protein